MKMETVRFLIWAVVFSLALVGAAVLTGCSAPAKYLFKCTVTQPENCN